MIGFRFSVLVCIILCFSLFFTIVTGTEPSALEGLITSDSQIAQSNNTTGDTHTSTKTGNLSPIDNESIMGLKGPKVNVTFTPEITDVGSAVLMNNTNADIIQNASVETGTENTSSVSAQYGSLGDIIKAKDWKALGEYNCKIKAENPELMIDTEVGSSDKHATWDSYFKAPDVIVYYPCCNG